MRETASFVVNESRTDIVNRPSIHCASASGSKSGHPENDVTIQTAAAIVQRLGPCCIAIDQAAHPDLARELALRWMRDGQCRASRRWAHARPVSWHGPPARPAPPLSRRFSSLADMDALILQSSGQPRHGMEQALFDAGWQRHPGGMQIGDDGSWTSYALPAVSYYIKAQSTPSRTIAPGWSRGGRTHRPLCHGRQSRASRRQRFSSPGAGRGGRRGHPLALSRAGEIRVADASLEGEPDNSIDVIIAFEPDGPADWIARLDLLCPHRQMRRPAHSRLEARSTFERPAGLGDAGSTSCRSASSPKRAGARPLPAATRAVRANSIRCR